MSQVQLLYQLQQLDTEIQAKKARLGDVIRAQKETRELLDAKKRSETAVAALAHAKTTHTDLDLELKSLNGKVKQTEYRLYSGNVKNPKELADLQEGIKALTRRGEVLEDEVLEAMILLEEAEEEAEAASIALANIQTSWEAEQVDLAQEKNALALQLHQLGEKRKAQTPLIEAPVLNKYNALLQRKNGIAVVKLRGNKCSGCQLNVSAQTVKRVQEGKVVNCASCERILFPL